MALLSVDNLSVSFVTRNGTNKAVDNVSFSVEERQITGIALPSRTSCAAHVMAAYPTATGATYSDRLMSCYAECKRPTHAAAEIFLLPAHCITHPYACALPRIPPPGTRPQSV